MSVEVHTCDACGARLRPAAKFCRACGAPATIAAASAASRQCGKCGHTNPGDSRFCRLCGGELSQDAAETLVAAPTARAARPALPPPSPPRPQPPAEPTQPDRRPRRVVLAWLAVGLVLVGGAAATVVVLVSGKSGHTPTVRASAHGRTSARGGSSAAANSSPSSGNTVVSTTGSESTTTASVEPNPHQDLAHIREVLYQHHEDIVQGDFRAAWELTSPQYRAQKLSQPGGYTAWVKDQKTLRPYLRPSGLKVSIVSWDPRSQVATVDLTGMGWTAPNSNCTTWSGITWVHYVGGQWYYEPGYSISAQRRAEWQPHTSELLGGSCGA